MAENPKAKDDPATKVASGKRNRQAVMEDVSPASNPNVPIRPTTNNDPGKVPTPEQLAPIAQQNSNVGIQQPSNPVPTRPAGSPPRQPLNVDQNADKQDRDYIFGLDRKQLEDYAKDPGKLSPSQRALVDEAKYQFMSGTHELQSESDKRLFSNAVNPNTAEYAQRQRQAYQQGISQPLTAQDRADMSGFEQGRYRIPTPVPNQQMQRQKQADAIALDDSTIVERLQNLAKKQGRDWSKLNEGQIQQMVSDYRLRMAKTGQAAERLGQAPATQQATTQQATTQQAPATTQLVPTIGGVPTRTNTPSHQRDLDYFTRVATSRTANPEDREMARGYLIVNQIRNDPKLKERYGRMLDKDIRTLEKQLQSQARTEERQAPHIRKARGIAGTQAEQLRQLKRTNPKAYQLQLWREVLRQPQYRGIEMQLGF
jgi:hypothetical protein